MDYADLQILMTNFGAGTGEPGVTPEPCSAMPVTFGALAPLRRRKA